MYFIFSAAWKNLVSDYFRTLLTVAGIAVGVTTVATILILDFNTNISESWTLDYIKEQEIVAPQTPVRLIPLDATGTVPRTNAKPTENVYAEDYQIMRSTVRLASLLAFFIGAIIVYYTIGFSIQQRKKELALLTALGATFSQISFIVLWEAFLMGSVGSLCGIISSLPLFKILKILNVTTTGKGRLFSSYIPYWEFLAVWFVGIITAIAGAIHPVWKLRTLNVRNALQPRFLLDQNEIKFQKSLNLFSLIVPILILTYILMRPFLIQFIPSIYFYVGEVGFIVTMFLVVIFFIPKVNAFLMKYLAKLFQKLFPLEVSLASSRFTHFTQTISWPISNIMLVFAFLLTLHLVTKSLKDETLKWGQKASEGMAFVLENGKLSAVTPEMIAQIGPDYTVIPMAIGSRAPNRILPMAKSELIKYLERSPQLAPIIENFNSESIVMSETMAAQLGVETGDWILVATSNGEKKFKLIGITDDLGYYPGDGTYRERKTYALVDQVNAFLLPPEQGRPGTRLVLWNKSNPRQDNQFYYSELVRMNQILKRRVHPGEWKIRYQVREINKDFVIFDVILMLATFLAALGVTNTMLIQLQARNREIALLQVLGMTGPQILKMVIIEGLFIGKIGGLLAIFLGIPLGWVSIQALNMLSVFKVNLLLSGKLFGLIFLGAILVSTVAAFYPALIGFRLKTSESIHYE